MITMKNKTFKKTAQRKNRMAAQPQRGLAAPLSSVVLGLGMLAAGVPMAAQATPIYCVANNDSYTVQQDTTLSGHNVVDNDSNFSSNCSTFVTSTASHGSVTMDLDGTFVYVPNNGYVGNDQFTYTLGYVCNAVVSIQVTPPASPPSANAVTAVAA